MALSTFGRGPRFLLSHVFTLSTILCFAVALLYVAGCDRLKGRNSHD